MVAQIALDVSTEGPEVGHPPPIGWLLAPFRQAGVPFLQLPLLHAQVLVEQIKAAQPSPFLLGEEVHAVLVEVERALDAAAARLAHAAPVLERLADQPLGGNGGDGL